MITGKMQCNMQCTISGWSYAALHPSIPPRVASSSVAFHTVLPSCCKLHGAPCKHPLKDPALTCRAAGRAGGCGGGCTEGASAMAAGRSIRFSQPLG